MRRHFAWIGAAAIIVIIFGTIYTAVQQSQRSEANSPQIQLAEDTATLLNNGSKPDSLDFGKVNINDSLAPFVLIYSKSGKPISGSGYLGGSLASAPAGVLNSANGKEYSAVTWQPRGNIRIASVTVAANNYYVLSGRSLRQVEINENRTFGISVLGCLLSVLVLSGTYIFIGKK